MPRAQNLLLLRASLTPQRDTTLVTRRRLLQAGLAAGAASLAPAVLRGAAKEPLRVSAYGGFFEKTLNETVIAQFTEETGIPVQTISQSGSDEWLFGLVRATRSNLAPVDLTILTEQGLRRLMGMGPVVAPIRMEMMPDAREIPDDFVFSHEGTVYGVGTMSWFQTLVVNPNTIGQVPGSWKEIFEEPRFRSQLGLNGNYNGGVLEIVARTYFDGADTLSTMDGVEAVIEKIGTLKPQTRLWWTSESQMEQALRNEEVLAGTYFHDVANLLAKDGFPIQSIFPEEGAQIGVGRLALLSTSDKSDIAHAYINFCARPGVQATFARAMGLNPVLPRDRLDLTDAEYAAVGSDRPPIFPAAALYAESAGQVQRRWQRMITG